MDHVSWGPLWNEYLQKGRPKRPRESKLDTTQNNASARPNSAGLVARHKFESGWLDRPGGPRPDRQTYPIAEAFLQNIHHPTTSNDDDITQDLGAMLKRGMDKHNTKAKAAKALHEKPYTRSHKFVESLPRQYKKQHQDPPPTWL